MRCPICKMILSEFDGRHHIKHNMTNAEFKKMCGIKTDNLLFVNRVKEAPKHELFELHSHQAEQR